MNAHLFVIHFPVSLGVIAAVLEIAGTGLNDRALRDWGWRFLLVAAFAVFMAFATGEGARLAALSTGGVNAERLEIHQEWGSVGIWATIAAALLRTLWKNRVTGAWGWTNLIVTLLAAGLLIAITLSGTAVRHVV